MGTNRTPVCQMLQRTNISSISFTITELTFFICETNHFLSNTLELILAGAKSKTFSLRLCARGI